MYCILTADSHFPWSCSVSHWNPVRPKEDLSSEGVVPPENISKLSGFLGLSSYYRQFVTGCATKGVP